MPQHSESALDRLAERRALRFWARAAEAAAAVDPETLRNLRFRARRIRREVDRVIAAADARLALPRIGSEAMPRQPGADWHWRPEPWRMPVSPRGHAGVASGTTLCGGVALFHDCPLAEISLRQERNRRDGDLAPFALRLEVLGFSGSFLSLAVDLPEAGVAGLSRRHMVRAELDADAERPVGLYARLNVVHGPNTEQLTASARLDRGTTAVEFDLAYTKLNEKRAEKAWIDLMFGEPALSVVRISDMRISRRVRAEV